VSDLSAPVLTLDGPSATGKGTGPIGPNHQRGADRCRTGRGDDGLVKTGPDAGDLRCLDQLDIGIVLRMPGQGRDQTIIGDIEAKGIGAKFIGPETGCRDRRKAPRIINNLHDIERLGKGPTFVPDTDILQQIDRILQQGNGAGIALLLSFKAKIPVKADDLEPFLCHGTGRRQPGGTGS